MMASPAQSIGELVEPLIITAGLELWDVEANPRAVRVLVDRPGGVDLEALSQLARVVSSALDERDDLQPSSQYQLEVSSPGVERTLRTPSHFQRYLGTEVTVKTVEPIDGSRRLQGILLAADDASITIRLPDGPRDLSYDQIQKARTVLVWGPAPKNRAGRANQARSEPMKDAAR
jgi:ribosome maturation factor RimP